MTQSHEKNYKKVPAAEQLSVNIALSITEPALLATCPTEMELAAFIDGRIGHRQSSTIWAHIDACDRCYQTWLFATANRESEAPIGGISSRRGFIFGAGATAAVAMLACILLYLHWPQRFEQDTDILIGSAYKILLDHTQPFSKQAVDKMFARSWQQLGQVHEYSGRMVNSPANLAFGAAIFIGRRQIIHPDSPFVLPSYLSPAVYADSPDVGWADTAYRDFYHLGQWCILLVAACSWPDDPLPDDFWTKQHIILKVFEKTFPSKAADDTNNRIAVKGIERIGEHLTQMKTMTQKKQKYPAIKSQVMNLVTLLSPVVISQ